MEMYKEKMIYILQNSLRAAETEGCFEFFLVASFVTCTSSDAE